MRRFYWRVGGCGWGMLKCARVLGIWEETRALPGRLPGCTTSFGGFPYRLRLLEAEETVGCRRGACPLREAGSCPALLPHPSQPAENRSHRFDWAEWAALTFPRPGAECCVQCVQVWRRRYEVCPHVTSGPLRASHACLSFVHKTPNQGSSRPVLWDPWLDRYKSAPCPLGLSIHKRGGSQLRLAGTFPLMGYLGTSFSVWSLSFLIFKQGLITLDS